MAQVKKGMMSKSLFVDLGSQFGVDRTLLSFQAAVTWPNDEAKQKQFVVTSLFSYIDDSADYDPQYRIALESTLDALDFKSVLIESPPLAKMNEHVEKAKVYRITVGCIMSIVLQLDRNEETRNSHKGASLNRAYDLVSSISGTPVSTLKTQWNKRRNVAHMCGGEYQALVDLIRPRAATRPGIAPGYLDLDVRELLKYSGAFQVFGRSFKPHAGKATVLLDDDIVQIPGAQWPSEGIQVSTFSPDELKTLLEYSSYYESRLGFDG